MRSISIMMAISLLSVSLLAQGAPVLFYSDLESGPASGGEGAKDGAFLCVYGERFGKERGNSVVELRGTPAAAYKVWSDPGQPYRPGHYAKVCVQVSHSTPVGSAPILLRTPQGRSNELPFTVTSGRVFFAASNGSDVVGAGSSEHPWQTIQHCKQQLAAGDVCYVKDMVVSKADNFGATLWLDSSGAPGRPKAIVAYPGAKVIFDANASAGLSRAVSNYNSKGRSSYWVLAGLSFDAPNIAVQIYPSEFLRLVDNDVRCTGLRCFGQDAGLLVGGPGMATAHITVLGNRFYDVGCHEDAEYQSSQHPCAWLSGGRSTLTTTGLSWSTSQWTSSFAPGVVIQAKGQLRKVVSCDPGCRSGKLDAPFAPEIPAGTTWQWRFAAPPKFFHTVYFGNTNSVTFGWNEIDGSKGQACRGLLFHSTAAEDEYDLHVHDNDIHDTVCDCIALSTVDPAKGSVEVFNNTLHRCGLGSVAVQQSSYAGIYIANAGDALPNPGRSGTVHVFHNTVYDAGIGGAPGYNSACFAFQTSTSPRHGSAGVEIDNNICQQSGVNQQSYLKLTGFDSLGKSEAAKFVTGSHNDCFGLNMKCPSLLESSLSVAPDFVQPSTADFRLQPQSAVAHSGKALTAAVPDRDGYPRSDRPAIGAFELSAQTH